MAAAAVVHPLHLALLLLVMLLHPCMLVAQTSRNLTAGGDPLTPPNYITSPSGDFAFGFLGNSTSGFLLAIWFTFDSTTVVWFATNASSGSAVAATSQSVLRVSTAGQLLLSNPGGYNPLWNPVSNYGSRLVLNDNGNLQFYAGAGGSSIVWESFKYPTDTLLPGQSMGPGIKLLSRNSDTDFSLGQFSFNVQTDGNIVMYRMDQLPAGEFSATNAYWSTDTYCCPNQEGNTTLFFDIKAVGHLYYILMNGDKSNLTTPILPSTTKFYQHATLDPDGIFRVYITSGKGNDTWSVMNNGQLPILGCKTLTNDKRGMCGPNSYCINRSDMRIDCECLRGYNFLDPQSRYMGCIPELLPDSCDGKSHAAEFELMQQAPTKWASLVSYKSHTSMSLEECSNNCLNSCFCAATLFDGNNCSEVGMLIAGWQENDATMMTLIKVRTKSTPPRILPYILIAALAMLLFASTFILLVHCYITYKKARRRYLSTRVFTRMELYRATNGFSKLLGEGEFGKVYHGTVKSLQPPDVAVKKLKSTVEYSEKEFENEVQSIGQIHHKNLVRMVGYCKEGVHRMLVFEYMQGGTLANFIFGSERPCWSFLANAAIGIAKGIEYLHEGCKSKIIHCDIKPDNILFDDKHIPKITDFGIAKLLGDQMTHKTINKTTLGGTKPYIAPEWYDGGDKVDSKVDVYSFGVVLLEIICCKRTIEKKPPDAQAPSNTIGLKTWVENLIRDGNAELLVQGETQAVEDMVSVKRFARIALWCLQREPTARPTMHEVVLMLEGDMEVDPLPDPPMPPRYSAILPSSSEIHHSSSIVRALQVE